MLLKVRAMKALHAICLFLIATPLLASAQHRTSPLTRAQTKDAERRLADLGYWAGPVDGLIDPATRSALIAFQKWEGRVATGQLTIEELEAIHNSAAPKARD